MIILRSQFRSIHLTMDYLIFSFTPQCRLPEKRRVIHWWTEYSMIFLALS